MAPKTPSKSATPNPNPKSNSKPPHPHFPPSSTPRVWLITAAISPIGIAIARAVLAHGDSVIAGVRDGELAEGSGERGDEFRDFYMEECEREEWKDRIKGVGLDGRCEGPYDMSGL